MSKDIYIILEKKLTNSYKPMTRQDYNEKVPKISL